METMTPNTSTGSISVTTPDRSTPETAILAQYQEACREVPIAEHDVEKAVARLKRARAEQRRLYKVASVIDPSLKQTRPKA